MAGEHIDEIIRWKQCQSYGLSRSEGASSWWSSWVLHSVPDFIKTISADDILTSENYISRYLVLSFTLSLPTFFLLSSNLMSPQPLQASAKKGRLLSICMQTRIQPRMSECYVCGIWVRSNYPRLVVVLIVDLFRGCLKRHFYIIAGLALGRHSVTRIWEMIPRNCSASTFKWILEDPVTSDTNLICGFWNEAINQRPISGIQKRFDTVAAL